MPRSIPRLMCKKRIDLYVKVLDEVEVKVTMKMMVVCITEANGRRRKKELRMNCKRAAVKVMLKKDGKEY